MRLIAAKIVRTTECRRKIRCSRTHKHTHTHARSFFLCLLFDLKCYFSSILPHKWIAIWSQATQQKCVFYWSCGVFNGQQACKINELISLYYVMVFLNELRIPAENTNKTAYRTYELSKKKSTLHLTRHSNKLLWQTKYFCPYNVQKQIHIIDMCIEWSCHNSTDSIAMNYWSWFIVRLKIAK